MSYHAGIDFGPRGPYETPRIECDGCGVRHSVMKQHGEPYAWFLSGKAPPKWKKEAPKHYCPRCRK